MPARDETATQSNQRQSLRMGVADPDENVVLCYGSNRSSVRVVDVSRGGFGIETDSDVILLLDQKIQLEMNNWIHDLRVAHIYKGNGVNRYGLQRLGDKPLSETPAYIKYLRSYANIGTILLNRAMRICRTFNPSKWQLSAGFSTTLAICMLVLLSAYLIKNGSLGGIRHSGRSSSSSAKQVVISTWGSSRTDFSTSQTAYQSLKTGSSPNRLGKSLQLSWLDIRMIFIPGDILYEVITRAVTYNNAPPGPPRMPGEMSRFNQEMKVYWTQLMEQIRLADEFLRNHQANLSPKTQVGTVDDSSATTTGSNSDTSDGTPDGTVDGTPDGTPDETVDGTPDGSVDGAPGGTVDGTPGNQQGNNTSPTPVTPSQGAGPSSNTGSKSSSTNSSDQNESATP